MLSLSEKRGGEVEKERIVGGCFYSAGQGKELKRRSFPCTPSWLEPQDGQPSLLMLVGPIVSIKAGPNQVVKSTRNKRNARSTARAGNWTGWRLRNRGVARQAIIRAVQWHRRQSKTDRQDPALSKPKGSKT